MKPTSAPWVEKTLLLAGVALILYAVGLVFYPFLSALLAAAIVAGLLNPLHARASARFPAFPSVVAAVHAGLASLLLALPLALAGRMLLLETQKAYPLARARLESVVKAQPAQSDALEGILERTLLENFHELAASATQLLGVLAKDALAVTLNALVFVLFLFFFLRDGPALLRKAAAYVPLTAAQKAKSAAAVLGMVNAVVRGIFAVALVQGLLAWLGLLLFGVPFPLLLGALCALFSPIPWVGSAVVWMPLVGRLLLLGQYAQAVPLALWFSLVVGLSDNVVRPALIGAHTKVPAPLAFIGLLGGVRAFGPAGAFIGPVLLALAAAVLEAIDEAPPDAGD